MHLEGHSQLFQDSTHYLLAVLRQTRTHVSHMKNGHDLPFRVKI